MSSSRLLLRRRPYPTKFKVATAAPPISDQRWLTRTRHLLAPFPVTKQIAIDRQETRDSVGHNSTLHFSGRVSEDTMTSNTSPKIYEPEIQQITKDMLGAEGPVCTADGDFYMVAPEREVDGKPAGQVLHVDLQSGQVDVVCEPQIDGYGGIPAGCQADKSGKLWVADMRLGLLEVNPSSGKFRQVCKRDNSFSPMQGCNDCVFDKHGNLWITAPAGRIAPCEYQRSMTEAFGSVYCYCDGVMTKIDTGYKFPNGIAVQYDQTGSEPKSIIVAETGTKTLWCLPITNAKLGQVDVQKKTVFGHCPGGHETGPDGMDFDSEGNLLVAHWGSGFIEVFNRYGGRPFTRIALPFKRVSNLHFLPNTSTLYITEHDSHGLWTMNWLYTGAKQYCEM